MKGMNAYTPYFEEVEKVEPDILIALGRDATRFHIVKYNVTSTDAIFWKSIAKNV